MLLLVLILVLIAFGLLVVALLAGNVLWAWVSVGVSVAAAAVLVIDWLQRRSAIKAGTEPPPELATGTGKAVGAADPITEVMAIVPPSAAQRTGSAGFPPGRSAAEGSAAGRGADARFGPASAAEQTVWIPAVQPSGSAMRPSGAEGGVTSSSGSSSPTVVGFPYGPPPASAAMSGGPGPTGVRPPDADATVVTRMDAGTRPDAGGTPQEVPEPEGSQADGSPLDGSQADGSQPDGSQADGTQADGTQPDGTARDDSPAGEPGATVLVDIRKDATAVAEADVRSGTPEDTAADGGAPGDGGAPTDGGAPGDGGTPGDGGVRGDGGAPAESATTVVGVADPASAPPEQAGADAGATVVVMTGGDIRPDGATVTVAPGDAGRPDPPGSPERPSLFEPAQGPVTRYSSGPPEGAGAPLGSGPAQDAGIPEAPVVPELPGAEIPEEPLDPAVAARVAVLSDEVIVIDEQPRYHLAGCRALAAAELIPLPAREAVELGFTPCAWCSPDRTLASRHPAPAR